MKFFLSVGVAATIGLAGCANQEASLKEPRLTNPPRKVSWQGWEDSSDGLTPTQIKYDGAFRLPLSEDWTWDIPDEGTWAVSRLELASATIAGDRVFAGSSREAGLFVLDRNSGALTTVITTEGPVQAPPTALEDGWLVVDSFGLMLRLDAELNPVWKEPFRVGGAVYRNPVLAGDVALVTTASDSVVAVGLDDGLWKWAYTREVPRGATELAILGAPAPLYVGSEVIAGFSDGAVVGLEANSGRELWAAKVGEGKFPDVQAEVLAYGDLYIASAFGGPVVGLDSRTHGVRWIAEEAAATSTMIIAGGYLYTSDTQGRVRCLDADTGEAVWTFEIDNAQFGPPTRAGGSILVGDVVGTLYAIDRFEGTEQWRFRPTDGSRLMGVAAAPAVDGRQIVFPSAGGTLWSLVANSSSIQDDSEEPAVRPDRVLGW
ncbi:MAG: PQQ-binding-like beta-propeller repeat protein [Proteobacteria bacterium]|nr:PQQ-binding-like beta-propeller repeat protein [Pseudomonadota bacterium]